MRPSEIYSRIGTALASSDVLKDVPAVANTYSAELIDDTANKHLRDTGLVICYYFPMGSNPKTSKRSLVNFDGIFTLACVENVVQHDTYLAANPAIVDGEGLKMTALQLAEEVMSVMLKSCEFAKCGAPQGIDFANPPIQRTAAEKGMVQFDVKLSIPASVS